MGPDVAEASAAAACSPTHGPGAAPPACWRPYGPDSPFNVRLPPRPRLLSGSEGVGRQLAEWGPAQRLMLGTADTEEDFWHPIYYARPQSPVFRIRCVLWRPCPVEGHRVRIPDEARPAAGSDAHLAVVDHSTGWEYDFWQVREKPRGGGRLVVGYGGRTRIQGSGLGAGATAAGFGLLAGIVRPPEMDAGNIRHALFIVVRCSNGRAVYPARRGSSGSPCRQFGLAADRAPPLGARLWLSLSERGIKQLGVPRWKRVLLLALHRYGGFVGDTMNGHSSFGVGFESGASYTSFGLPDPWVRFGRSAGGIESDGSYILELDSGVDWGQFLRVVHPCESRGRCRRGG